MKGLQTIQVEILILICSNIPQNVDTKKPLEALDYEIVGTGYRNNTMKRQLSEALFIKELKLILSKQEKSLPLKLFK